MIYRLWLLLHLSAIIVWVGGMCFAHFALRPAATLLEPPQGLTLMAAALGRFFNWVSWAVVLILVSGLMMMMLMAGGARGLFALPASTHLMLSLGVVMMMIFGHIRFALYKRLAAAVAKPDWPAAIIALGGIRLLVSVNLALGAITLVVAIVGPEFL